MGGEAGRAPSGGLRSCACSRTGWGRHHHHHSYHDGDVGDDSYHDGDGDDSYHDDDVGGGDCGGGDYQGD